MIYKNMMLVLSMTVLTNAGLQAMDWERKREDDKKEEEYDNHKKGNKSWFSGVKKQLHRKNSKKDTSENNEGKPLLEEIKQNDSYASLRERHESLRTVNNPIYMNPILLGKKRTKTKKLVVKLNGQNLTSDSTETKTKDASASNALVTQGISGTALIKTFSDSHLPEITKFFMRMSMNPKNAAREHLTADQKELLEAIEANDIAKVKELVGKLGSLNFVDKNAVTPANAAIRNLAIQSKKTNSIQRVAAGQIWNCIRYKEVGGITSVRGSFPKAGLKDMLDEYKDEPTILEIIKAILDNDQYSTENTIRSLQRSQSANF